MLASEISSDSDVPAQATKPSKPSKPLKSSKPSKPTKPSKPVKPSKSAKRSKPAKSSKAANNKRSNTAKYCKAYRQKKKKGTGFSPLLCAHLHFLFAGRVLSMTPAAIQRREARARAARKRLLKTIPGTNSFACSSLVVDYKPWMELEEYQVGEFPEEICDYCGALLFKGEVYRCCDFGQVCAVDCLVIAFRCNCSSTLARQNISMICSRVNPAGKCYSRRTPRSTTLYFLLRCERSTL